jgi:hypothetical protein
MRRLVERLVDRRRSELAPGPMAAQGPQSDGVPLEDGAASASSRGGPPPTSAPGAQFSQRTDRTRTPIECFRAAAARLPTSPAGCRCPVGRAVLGALRPWHRRGVRALTHACYPRIFGASTRPPVTSYEVFRRGPTASRGTAVRKRCNRRRGRSFSIGVQPGSGDRGPPCPSPRRKGALGFSRTRSPVSPPAEDTRQVVDKSLLGALHRGFEEPRSTVGRQGQTYCEEVDAPRSQLRQNRTASDKRGTRSAARRGI